MAFKNGMPVLKNIPVEISGKTGEFGCYFEGGVLVAFRYPQIQGQESRNWNLRTDCSKRFYDLLRFIGWSDDFIHHLPIDVFNETAKIWRLI